MQIYDDMLVTRTTLKHTFEHKYVIDWTVALNRPEQTFHKLHENMEPEGKFH